MIFVFLSIFDTDCLKGNSYLSPKYARVISNLVKAVITCTQVAASRHPQALFRVSPMLLRSQRSWHQPTHSVPVHLHTNLHGLGCLAAPSPRFQISYAASSCPSSHHPSPSWPSLPSSWVLCKPHGANRTPENARQASHIKRTLPVAWQYRERLEPWFLASTAIYCVPLRPPTPTVTTLVSGVGTWRVESKKLSSYWQVTDHIENRYIT